MEHKPKNQYQHIIYIGCGASVAMDTLAGQAERLWLIDAADQVIEQLRLQAETQDLPVCIQQVLVLPQTQQSTFYEYSLPWVNGPTQADDSLHRLYPGLCRTRETQQQGLGVVELLRQCLANAEQTEACTNNLLIIDLEQQTQALLHALAESDVLHCFAQVLVVPPHRGQPISLPSSLQEAHEPLPAGVPQNTQAYQLAQWVLELQRLQQQLAQTRVSEQKHKDWAHSLKQQLESSRQEDAAKAAALQQAEQQLNELTTQCGHLSQQRDEQTKLADERQAQLQQRTQERDAKNGELLQLQQQLANIKASEQKHKDWANTLKQQLEQAEQQLNELAKQCEHLSQQRDEQSRLADERQAQLQHYAQGLDAKSTELSQLQQQLSESKASEQKHKELANSLKQQLDQARQEDATKDAELKQGKQQQSELVTLRDGLVRQRDEQAKLANERQAQLQQRTQERDAKAAELAEMTKQRDQLKQELETATQKAKTSQQCLEHEQAERWQHIDQELLKTEAQLSLIKELLLSDKVF